MTLKELVARNVSAALREVANAEAVAKHSKDGTIPNGIAASLNAVRTSLSMISDMLADRKDSGQPLP